MRWKALEEGTEGGSSGLEMLLEGTNRRGSGGIYQVGIRRGQDGGQEARREARREGEGGRLACSAYHGG